MAPKNEMVKARLRRSNGEAFSFRTKCHPISVATKYITEEDISCSVLWER